jgi:lipopolysaccharide export LptBFGC system permease protein LptF
MTEFVFGIVAGMIITAVIVNIAFRIATRRAEQQLEQLVEAVKSLSANQIQARVEEQDGVFYVYRVDDNSFLAQGTTMAELRERIESRMKDAMVYVTEGDAEVLARLKATRQETTGA